MTTPHPPRTPAGGGLRSPSVEPRLPVVRVTTADGYTFTQPMTADRAALHIAAGRVVEVVES